MSMAEILCLYLSSTLHKQEDRVMVDLVSILKGVMTLSVEYMRILTLYLHLFHCVGVCLLLY